MVISDLEYLVPAVNDSDLEGGLTLLGLLSIPQVSEIFSSAEFLFNEVVPDATPFISAITSLETF